MFGTETELLYHISVLKSHLRHISNTAKLGQEINYEEIDRILFIDDLSKEHILSENTNSDSKEEFPIFYGCPNCRYTLSPTMQISKSFECKKHRNKD